MKRISMIIVVALTLALLAYAHSRIPKAKSETLTSQSQPGSSTDRTVATQRRLNDYFHRDVIPKLRTCWKDVQGEGLIEMKFTYTKSGGGWTWEKLERSSSTLPRGQDAVALRCMQDAVRGTSFPVEESDNPANIKEGAGAANKFVVHWNWPVPLPANSAEFAEFRKKAGGGKTGGCDGLGTPAKCYTCSNSKCIKVCVGYETCTLAQDKLHLCSSSGYCASGGPFGGSGGVVMY